MPGQKIVLVEVKKVRWEQKIKENDKGQKLHWCEFKFKAIVKIGKMILYEDVTIT